MAVAPAVNVESRPFEQHREVGRLLKLDEEDSLADRVRESSRDEEAVAWTDGQLVECVEQGRAILTIDPARENVEIDVFAKAEPRRWALVARLDDQPGLRLAVSEAEVASGECLVRMEVNRQPLAGVEQLHEQRAIGAVLRRVRRTEVRDRIGRDRVSEQPPVRERAQAGSVRSEHRRGRPDPVFRGVVVGRPDAAEARDRFTAAVEVVKLVRRELDRVHGFTSPEPRTISAVGRTMRCGGLSSPARRCASSSAAPRPRSAASYATTVTGTASISPSSRSSKPTSARRNPLRASTRSTPTAPGEQAARRQPFPRPLRRGRRAGSATGRAVDLLVRASFCNRADALPS